MYYIANWKMNLTLQESLDFVTTHNDDLVALAQDLERQIVLCPSHESLVLLAKLFDTTPVAIGGQDCSAHTKGSYTGQTSAQSLEQSGCTYCIIGHSERRLLNHESSDEIADKLLHLLDFGITPIVCIGELLEEYETDRTQEVLAMQLAPIFATLAALPSAGEKTILLAYEPVWSIGSGNVASAEHLGVIFAWLQSRVAKERGTWQLLYGGSVDENNVRDLKKIEHISGFLIGKASVSFQQLKKIVE